MIYPLGPGYFPKRFLIQEGNQCDDEYLVITSADAFSSR